MKSMNENLLCAKKVKLEGRSRCSRFLTALSLLAFMSVNAAFADTEKPYTITPTETKGDYTMTTYSWNDETKSLDSQYYDIKLQTTYGDLENYDEDKVRYYKFGQHSAGTQPLDPATADDYDIKFNPNNTREISNKRVVNDTDIEGYNNNFVDITSNLDGGAILNTGKIESITGDFININTDWTHGGAIFNKGEIGTITANFIDNYMKGHWINAGAAITNEGSIDKIEGVFINNIAGRGTIHNWGHIGELSGIFIGNGNNYDKDSCMKIDGEGRIDILKADFIGNLAYNGVIDMADNASIGTIIGDFIGNTSSGSGGAIAANGTIVEGIYGDFINNTAMRGTAGAIGWIKTRYIKGNFIGNSAGESSGAIYLSNYDGEGTTIEGNFIGNHATTHGGAIVSEGADIRLLHGDFINNYIKNETSVVTDASDYQHYSWGGAISYDRCNGNSLKEIIGDFIGNHVESVNSPSYAGAVANFYDAGGHMGVINGDFLGNYVKSEKASANGGAYVGLSEASMDELNSNLAYNYVDSGVIARGGAIFNRDSRIGEINGNIENNYAYSKSSNALGGAIYNESQIGGNYTNLSGEEKTGAIRGSLVNNYAKTESEDKLALGGAVFTGGDMVFEADGKTNYISGNYTEDSRGKRDNAIFVRTNKAELNSSKNGYNYESSTPVLTFNTKNNGKFVINDTIEGGELTGNAYKGQYETFEEVVLDGISYNNKYDLKLEGDNTGAVYLNNDVINANLILDKTNLYLGRDDVLKNSDLTLNSGLLSMINNQVGTFSTQKLTLNGDVNLLVDVDLANSTMDKISASDYGEHKGNVIVSGMNLLSDSNTAHTEILFADKGLKNNVVNTVNALPNSKQTEVFTPIYRYTVDYANREDGGYFIFNQGGLNSSNESLKYNPSVLSTPVAAQAGGQATVNETVRFAFQHADMFSQMPYTQRMAMIHENQYAISEGTPKYSHNFEQLDKGYWFKPYASFERINLHNGPDVDAIVYGTMVGFDSDFKKLKGDWYNVRSIYAGYNGASLSYKGVDTTLNGGVAGLTETFYKGNFFTALTATAGASVGENQTMYGNEDYTMLLGGVGSKTGYDFEFKNGKYILQPVLFMNYSFVNTFDYRSASGLKMKSDPLHTFQINPSLKFIANLENGWQPYASVGMVWNVLNSGKVKADDVILPKMTVDPYVEYGVGLQRTWKDKFTGFGQAMVRNGGRNGVALTFGFRWSIGKDSEDL